MFKDLFIKYIGALYVTTRLDLVTGLGVVVGLVAFLFPAVC